MIQVALAAAVIFVAFAAVRPRHAEAGRPRPFPTFGGGLVSTTADEDAHAYLWAGIAVRPSSAESGRFVAFAVDFDFHGDVATVVPNVRLGWVGFSSRSAALPIVQSYMIVGYGKQQVEGRTQDVFRIGSGFCIPYMLRAIEFGLAVPSTIEVALDMGSEDTELTFRLGWGF